MESLPMEAGAQSRPPLATLDRRAKFEILGAILLGLFLGALDQTVVGTALPRIVTDLGGNELYTWVVTIYLLTSTITVPFYGKLSDIYGRRPLLMVGIALFLIGSALSGLSQNMAQLIAFRGLQGIGAGALFPISLAVIGDLFSPAERGKYQGLFGAVFGVSFLVGPALGGFLTDNVSWHWVFYVNLPIGLASLYIIWRLLPNVRTGGRARDLDYIGALIFTIGIGFLLVGLTNKQTGDWTDPTVGGFIAIAAVLTPLFLFVESRAKEPIIPLHLWGNRAYPFAMIATFLVSFGFFGAVIFIPRWFQVVRGESATASGYLMFPLLLGLIGSSIVGGAIVSRTGRYKLLLLGSLVAMAVGMLFLSQLTADTSLLTLSAWMFVAGVGIGPTLPIFTIAVQNAAPISELGVATSNQTFFRQIGGSVGLAIAGTVFATQLQNTLPGKLQPVFGQVVSSLPAQFQAQAASGLHSLGSGSVQQLQNFTGVGQSFGHALVLAVPPQFQAFFAPYVPQLDHAFFEALSAGIASTFIVGFATAVGAIVATAAMKELPLRSQAGATAEGGAAAQGAVAAGRGGGVPAPVAPAAVRYAAGPGAALARGEERRKSDRRQAEHRVANDRRVESRRREDRRRGWRDLDEPGAFA